MNKLFDRTPIVCVCEVNCRIAVVLADDFWAATVNFWNKVRAGDEAYDAAEFRAYSGRLIPIPEGQVVVFQCDDPEYGELAKCCFVQRATFEVPLITQENRQEIIRHIFGLDK